MLQKIFIRRWFTIIAAFIVLQFPFTVLAQVEISSKNKGADKFLRAQIVDEEASPKNDVGNYWRLGKWRLSELLYLEADYWCSINRSYDFWPVLRKCSGDFVVRVDKEKFSENHEKEIHDLEKKLKRDLDGGPPLSIGAVWKIKIAQDEYWNRVNRLDQVDWKVPIKDYRSTSEFFDAVKNDGHLLIIDDQSYEVENFSEIAGRGIDLVVSESNNHIKEERREILFGAAFAALGLIFLLFLFVKLVRLARSRFYQAKEKVQQLKEAAADQLDKLQAANQRRKVRSVVVDETIREMTRTALSATDDKSKEILIAELRKAIESGNHELANALELALKKA